MKFQKTVYVDPADMLDLVQERIHYIDFLERVSGEKTKTECVLCLVTIDAVITAKDLTD